MRRRGWILRYILEPRFSRLESLGMTVASAIMTAHIAEDLLHAAMIGLGALVATGVVVEGVRIWEKRRNDR